jgi:glucose/arabinose dehydrogenase
MKTLFSPLLLLPLFTFAQQFTRTELPTTLSHPWEMTYGADGYLWITEEKGSVVRVDPLTGAKTVVYQAPDFFGGHTSECCQLCHQPKIGSGTLGLALHPDFLNPSNSYVYFVYSYNSGTALSPATKFKIARIKWDASSQTVTSANTLVDKLPTGFDHFGGRLKVIDQNSVPYIFFTIGDNGISEDNSPDCYDPPSSNPNNVTQDPNYKTGKIHRFNIDGTIPADNPLPGNSFYTRGHRNPQGLIYNSTHKIIYDVEHGDRTDDEINVLVAGMNYGWKQVRGYHSDGNYPGELQFVANYQPYPNITNDALQEPLYAWCAATQCTLSNNYEWGTVAPSDGIYYDSDGIPGWKNSLLVGTLKKGKYSDKEVYVFHLNADGKSLAPSTVSDPNPQRFFANDQDKNGRIRDITFSADGKKLFLMSDGGLPTGQLDKITVYTYIEGSAGINSLTGDFKVDLYPNPASDFVNIHCSEKIQAICLCNIIGESQNVINTPSGISLMNLAKGTYFLNLKTASGITYTKKIEKY